LRFQQTRFNGVLSALREVQLGVPQGSVIGPLLFILYMNDIVKAIVNSQVNLFADDTLLSVAADTVVECIQKMQEDLNALSDWLKFNKLKLNVSKTKFMIMTNKRLNATDRVILSIDGEQIEEVRSMKYLGVQIDSKLNFKEHLNLIVKKIAKKTNFLGRISKKLTAHTKKMIYKSIILPHVDYCSSIMFMATKEDFRKLQLLQNRALRVILKKPKRTPIKWMLDTLKLHSIKQRVNFNTLVLVFKMKNGMVPSYMQDEVLFTRNATTRTLRNAEDFRLPRYLKTTTQNMIWHDGLRMFNELPPSIKQGRNLEEFKCQIFEIMRERFPV
jgi:Reverse transcriptase (RNA-dependent DNA polymerase)